MLTRLCRKGLLTRPYEGTYVVSGTAATWERAVSVAVLSSGDGAVASHATAAHLFDLAFRPKLIEVSVPLKGIRDRDHVIHRSTDLIPAEVTCVKGIAVTTVARLLVDIGIPWGEGLAARCLREAVRRQLVTYQDVAKVLHRVARRGRNGVGPMRIVLMEHLGLSELTESQAEEEFLRIMVAAGMEMPEPQVTVHRRGGRVIARVDFIYHQYKLVIELDGERYHSDSNTFRKDRRKQNALVLEGYRVLRFTYWDLFIAPEVVVAEVAAAIAQSR